MILEYTKPVSVDCQISNGIFYSFRPRNCIKEVVGEVLLQGTVGTEGGVFSSHPMEEGSEGRGMAQSELRQGGCPVDPWQGSL